MQTLIGDFGEPLTCLAIDIVQIGEGAQRPEVLANVADAAALHFSFLPTRGRIAGAWNEAELTREGEEARLKPHQPPIVFGDGGGQVVVPDLAADAAQELEGMNVAANESLKALAMGELQVQHPAVALHQGEGVKLALVAGVIERAEVTPIDFEAFPGDRLHAHKCARRWLGPDLADILAQNRVAAIVAHCAETTADLEAKLREFQKYFNEHRTHAGLEGRLPDSGGPGSPISFPSYRWQKHCRGQYQTPIAA